MDAGSLRLVRRGPFDVFAVEAKFAVVRSVNASDDLDERGLACAVLSKQSPNFAGCNGKIDAIERTHARKGLRYALGFNNHQAKRRPSDEARRACRAPGDRSVTSDSRPRRSSDRSSVRGRTTG